MGKIIDVENDPLFKEGIEIGIQKGRQEGIQEGIQKGRQEGIKLGEKNIIKKMLLDNKLTLQEISEFTGFSLEGVQSIDEE